MPGGPWCRSPRCSSGTGWRPCGSQGMWSNPFLTRAEEEQLRGAAGVAGAGGRQSSRPRVTGTLWSPQRRVAWVDGRPRVEGEQVGNARIVRIERDQVVMRRGGRELRIPVSSGPRPLGQEER